MVNTTRFGAIEIVPEDILRFPEGLIGLPGHEYVLLPAARGPFTWLQSLADPAIALPLTHPEGFFRDFALELGEEDAERIGDAPTEVFVTVRATPVAAECTANLKAPIVVIGDRSVSGREAHQVVNLTSGAQLRAPLFAGRQA